MFGVILNAKNALDLERVVPDHTASRPASATRREQRKLKQSHVAPDEPAEGQVIVTLTPRGGEGTSQASPRISAVTEPCLPTGAPGSADNSGAPGWLRRTSGSRGDSMVGWYRRAFSSRQRGEGPWHRRAWEWAEDCSELTGGWPGSISPHLPKTEPEAYGVVPVLLYLSHVHGLGCGMPQGSGHSNL